MPNTLPVPPLGSLDFSSEFLPEEVDYSEAFDFGVDFSFLPDKPIGAAPRWHFWGVGGVGRGRFEKKGVTLRGATDFREERNPPQADNIVSIVPYNITILPYNIAILYHIMRTVLQSTILW